MAAGDDSVRIEVQPWLSWPRLSPMWSELAEAAPDASFFVGHGWVDSWIQTFGAQLRPKILVFRSDDRVVGICLVVFRTKLRGPVPVRRAYLNSSGEDDEDVTCPEYNHILCRPGYEAAVGSALRTWLAAAGWDEFFANALADDTALAPLDRCDVVRSEVNSYFVDTTVFAPTVDGFLSRLSRNTRSQIRRSMRLYQEAGELRVQSAETAAQAEAFLTELATLHQAAWRSRGEQGVFASPRFFNFHKLLIAKVFAAGGIKLLRVRAGETTIAVLYLFARSGKVMFYQSGLQQTLDNRLKPGLVAHALAIAELAAAGHREYDFLAGESQYKKSLSTASRRLVWLVFRRRGLKQAAIDLLKQVRAQVEKWGGKFAIGWSVLSAFDF
jgi:CelD/BcsL family acetyltransferase involved in cellulose biosynthesis